MQYIPIAFVREGMTVAKAVFGANGNLLLSAGTKINNTILNRLISMKYNGVYVEDEPSFSTDGKSLIRDHLKSLCVKPINTNMGKSQICGNEFEGKRIEIILNHIIDKISDNEDIMISLLDLKTYDHYTYCHSVQCTMLALIAGMGLGLSNNQIYELGLSAILHDIGKLFIPKEILNKNGPLSDSEFEIMKQHSVLGYNFLKGKTDIPDESCLAVLQHHEKYNGIDGYPFGSKGEKLTLYGRILSVADVYDALTSDRSYRKSMPPSEAMEYLIKNGGRMFDPELVQVFCNKIRQHPIGTCVQLENGEVVFPQV